MIQPETRYTTVGDDRVAYQVLGEGPLDLVVTQGRWGHLDLEWEDPGVARFLRRLVSFSRLIRFDARGSGLSDARPNGGGEVSQYWTEDLLAVMDATGSKSAAFLAWIDGAPLALQFAAAHPGRVRALALFNPAARRSAAPDYPQGFAPETTAEFLDFTRKSWGTEKHAVAICPSLAHDERTLRWVAKWQRAVASPKAVVESMLQARNFDARPILFSIRAPTLVMARGNSRWWPLAQARYVAEHTSGARLVELPGADGQPFWETPELILDHVEEFVTGQRRGGEAERALLTVLFTDIVDSTALAAKMGDAAWHALLNRHDQITAEQIARFGGRLVNRTGDGMLASFDRPGRAIECARALHEAMATVNLRLRAGLHTAEVELRDDGDIGGISVHVGARVMAAARAGEVLVSHSVQAILLGSHYNFEKRGIHDLKGVPGEWTLFAVGQGDA
ncbi:MAG: alpha/beta fold hydrolase [Nevskiales bacterium]